MSLHLGALIKIFIVDVGSFSLLIFNLILTIIHICNLNTINITSKSLSKLLTILNYIKYIIGLLSKNYNIFTCWEDVASSTDLSSLILINLGNRKEIPFSGSTCYVNNRRLIRFATESTFYTIRYLKDELTSSFFFRTTKGLRKKIITR